MRVWIRTTSLLWGLLLALVVQAQDAGPPVQEGTRYPGSFYRHLGDAIYFGKVQDGRRLDADPATFRVHGEDSFDFQYLTPLGADGDAFFLAWERIAFPGAHRARVLAPNNNGDCMYLIVSGAKLYRVNKNEKQVEPVAGDARVKKLEVVATGNRRVPPLYFKDDRAVYFYLLDENRLAKLPRADPESFRCETASYGFELYLGLDARRVYAGPNPIRGVHRPSFAYVGWVYAKDRRRVYVISNQEWSVLRGADPKTFQVVKGRGIDAVDKNHQYKAGRVVD